MDSVALYKIAQSDVFQAQVTVLGVKHAQNVMNQYPPGDPLGDLDHHKLQAKAQEFLNNPDSFKEKLALSVVVLLPDEAFSEDTRLMDAVIEDGDIELYLPDAFDALAGVTSSG